MYALVDGVNFYLSCERVFGLGMKGRPFVVLSTTTVAPWFKIKHLEDEAWLVTIR